MLSGTRPPSRSPVRPLLAWGEGIPTKVPGIEDLGKQAADQGPKTQEAASTPESEERTVSSAPGASLSPDHPVLSHSREDERRQQVQGVQVDRRQKQQPQGAVSKQALRENTAGVGGRPRRDREGHRDMSAHRKRPARLTGPPGKTPSSKTDLGEDNGERGWTSQP